MPRSSWERSSAKQEAALRNVLPVTPVNGHNGHAAADGLLTFSGAQAEEKRWSAKLKELEYLEPLQGRVGSEFELHPILGNEFPHRMAPSETKCGR